MTKSCNSNAGTASNIKQFDLTENNNDMKTEKTITKTRAQKSSETPDVTVFNLSGESAANTDYSETSSAPKIRHLMNLASAEFEPAEADELNEDLFDLFLAQTLNIISLSPTGLALINDAVENGWSLDIDDLDGNDFSVDVAEKLIIVNNFGLSPEGLMRSAYFGNLLLVNLVRALRDVWHEKRHGGFDDLFGPEAILMLERIRAADCDTIGIMVAWELRSENYSDIWRHSIGSENGDIAMTYSTYMERDPSSQFNGRALKAAFQAWYECEQRITICDHQTLEYMDDILKFSDLQRPFGKKVPTHICVELLSCLPDKTAYLQGYGQEILRDPTYSGLSDPLNQSHLMHILHDMEATIINNVPFRNADLAARIFPADTDLFADE